MKEYEAKSDPAKYHPEEKYARVLRKQIFDNNQL